MDRIIRKPDFSCLSYSETLAPIPPPNTRRLAVHIQATAERAVRQGHPWLFDQSIQRISNGGEPGDLAVLFDRKRRFLAIGLYDPASPIRVRLLQANQPATIDQAWLGQRLATAIAHRASLLNTNTTGYRLVHGENDGLPGLVVDRYADTLVMKLYSVSWVRHLAALAAALLAHFPAARLILRLSRAVQAQPAHLYGLRDGQLLHGTAGEDSVIFQENGLRFAADVCAGQKTGFFLDQRDNRARVESLAWGREVLNVFAYTGGFSVYAARGGARRIVSVDLNAQALAGAERNFALNADVPAISQTHHETWSADAFTALAALGAAGRQFDLVILDPPAFAQKQADVAGALVAYRRLAQLGAALLPAGGILVSASCSSRVAAAEFWEVVHEGARQSSKRLREIARTTHPLDHPISFAEGAYLKCLFAYAT